MKKSSSPPQTLQPSFDFRNPYLVLRHLRAERHVTDIQARALTTLTQLVERQQQTIRELRDTLAEQYQQGNVAAELLDEARGLAEPGA